MTDDRATERQRLIAALIGPGEPELTCEECFEQLDRYVDLELAGDDADAGVPRMRAHLAGCPACLEDHASLRAFVAAPPGGHPTDPYPPAPADPSTA